MGKRSRTKGHQWERDVANLLAAKTGRECKRNLTETREGNTGDLVTTLPLSIQCKVGQRPRPIAAYLEAVEAAGDHEIPVAAIRQNGAGSRPPVDVAVLDLEDFSELVALLVAHGLW